MNQDHDRGDKGDRGLTVVMGVPKEGEGKFLRTGLRTGGRALKVVQEVLSDLRRKGNIAKGTTDPRVEFISKVPHKS